MGRLWRHSKEMREASSLIPFRFSPFIILFKSPYAFIDRVKNIK